MSFSPAIVHVQINGKAAPVSVFVPKGDAFAAALTAYVTVLATAKRLAQQQEEE